MVYSDPILPLNNLGILVCFILLVIVIVSVCRGSKSRRYRRLITDLYVVGKIKQMATDDKVDLKKEELEFLKALKSERSRLYALDEMIEAEINERVGTKREK